MAQRLDTVERFAKLCARLDDPFAERHAVLVAHELTEATLEQLFDRWSRHLEQSAAGTEQFSRAYAAERQRLRDARREQAATRAACSAGHITVRRAAAVSEIDCTSAVVRPVLEPALRFVSATASAPTEPSVETPEAATSSDPAAASEVAEQRVAAPPTSVDSIDETGEVSLSLLQEPVLPFARSQVPVEGAATADAATHEGDEPAADPPGAKKKSD